MFLSVIIPTYRNTKEEIEQCLGSIYQSDWRDFEVLLVDDGNTAEYAAYLDTLPARFAGLRILHLPHGGVSAARNAAVSEAQGDYILFVDADDLVTKQFWEDVKEIASRGIEADIIYGMAMVAKRESFLSPDIEPFFAFELNKEEKQELYAYFFALRGEKFRVERRHFGRGSVYRMLRRELAIRCVFDITLGIGEDMPWNLAILRLNPRVFMTNHIWYVIIENPKSATRRYRTDLIEVRRKLLLALRPYNTDDTWNEYRMVIFESLADIGKRYYLSPQNSLPWFQKVKEFNQVAWSEPFNAVLETNEKMGGGKGLLKLVFYKTGLLLYAYKLKMLLGR